MAKLLKKTVKPVEDKGEIRAAIVAQPLVEEMKQAYLEYAMSVIVSRALPDVRDGLKPVHRRILYAMWSVGLRATAKFRKSAMVVGEVLGKYHPHGDTAVYDSMVRMAQDFSLRVPLIKGQGNWGCFTKDTKVKLVDGRDVSFGDLIKENETGKKNYTYTVNSLGLIAMAEIKNPRRTIKNAQIIKITLDNGEVIKCTPNHKFLLKDGLYKEAQNLEKTDSIMPLYQRLSEKADRINRDGYILIYQPKIDTWIPAHHLADNFNLTHHRYSKSAGRVRHHLDFNKLNNSPENLIRMQWGDHWKIHYENAHFLHNDPEYRRKLAEGRNKYLALPETKEKNKQRMSARNKKNWQNPEYREKMSQFLSEMNIKYIQDHPERCQELSMRATQTLTKLWQDPEYQASMHEKIIKGNKNHTTNITGKLKFLNICRQILERKLKLDESNYDKIKSEVYPYGKATLWANDLNKYFQNNINLIRQEINKNHKVIKIEKISQHEDVYDLTIDGTHNFCLSAGIFVHNSIDGDSAAAIRYTECKLTASAEEMLTDIEKNTVDFIPNYDGVHKEPVVLPAKLPNLLINGVDGIAVGMATSIPPHNPVEVIAACVYKIDNPKATVEELMKIMPGPDLPTGAIIYNKKDILEAYSTGKGRIVVRGVAAIEDDNTIVITAIPYQVNKTTLEERIAELVQNKTIDAIKDLRDESNKEGIRIVVGLKKDSYPQKVLNQLYKHTQLQEALHVNMLALVDGVVPKVLTLPEILDEFIKHRKDVIRRRTQYDLDKTLDRLHILEGLTIALAHIDEVIAIIKKSKDRADAKVNLMKKFKLSALQTDAILDMRLHSLANLERLAVETELGEQKKKAEEYQAILAQEKKLVKVIRDELVELSGCVDGDRRTKIVAHAIGEMSAEDLIANDPALIVKTEEGYIKRLAPDTFRTQSRGGKGVSGVTTKEEDIVAEVLSVMTHDNILFFTSRGRCFSLKAYEIPVFSRTAKGQALQNFLQLSVEEKVTSMLPIKNFEDGGYVAMVTTEGTIKRVALAAFSNIRRSGIIAIKLHNGDLLQWVKLTRKQDSILLASEKGQAIRFKEGDVREMGRAASGVRGIRLDQGDRVIGMEVVPEKADPTKTQLMAVSKNGYGKRTRIGEYKIQGRGGSGIKTMAVSAKTGPLVQTIMVDMTVNEASDVLVISAAGQIIRLPLKTVNVLGRSTQGVRIMRFKKEGDNVVSLTLI